MIRAAEIDILIDLNGLTRGARPGILRMKPAAGSGDLSGLYRADPLPELDWLICDAVTIPPEDDALYHPRPLRISGCYQANDARLPALPDLSAAG